MSERYVIGSTPVQAKLLPPRLVIYGEPKIGKSVFGAAAPKPIFICTEDGADGLPIVRIPTDAACSSWDELMDCLRSVLVQEHDRETLVIDTLDLCESLAAKHVLTTVFGGSNEKYMAYHKGPVIAGSLMETLMMALDHIRKKRGMRIVLLAHDGLAPGANALGEDFKKWSPNLTKYSWNRIRDWADQIGHAQSDFLVLDGKAKGGRDRHIHFRGSPGRDAGCRAGYEMPDKIKLSWSEYQQAQETLNGN
tara:strand:+ start:1807 stop:2556 length:750 start_codon:yes stop_codon:yes gene_type:complete